MAALNLPNKLYRPLAEVKNFVEKMTDGVRLPQMSQKVKSFASLSRKDKDILIRYLNERDCIHVIQARPLNGGNLTTFFYHHKFGLPASIPGFDWNGRPPKITMPVEEVPETEEIELMSVPVIESEAVPIVEKPLPSPSPVVIEDEETETESEEIPSVNIIPTDADDLRKRALEMLMQADKAEQTKQTHVLTEIKPKIDDFISRLNVANDAVQSTLDMLYDQMGEVDKISMEFKKFCASL